MTNEGVCVDNGTKVDVAGSHTTITLTAPTGYLISGYCVKAGSVQQGLGPEYVTVSPAQPQVVIAHTSGKDISHYTYTLTPTPTPVCTRPGEQTVSEGPACTPTTTVTTSTRPPATTVATTVTSVVSVPPPSGPPTTTPSSVSSAVLHSTASTGTAQPEQLAYTGVDAGMFGLLGILFAVVGYRMMQWSKKLSRKS